MGSRGSSLLFLPLPCDGPMFPGAVGSLGGDLGCGADPGIHVPEVRTREAPGSVGPMESCQAQPWGGRVIWACSRPAGPCAPLRFSPQRGDTGGHSPRAGLIVSLHCPRLCRAAWPPWGRRGGSRGPALRGHGEGRQLPAKASDLNKR